MRDRLKWLLCKSSFRALYATLLLIDLKENLSNNLPSKSNAHAQVCFDLLCCILNLYCVYVLTIFNKCWHFILEATLFWKHGFIQPSNFGKRRIFCHVRRSFGVQISWDICTRFGCYLYSTEWSWIIIVHIFLTFPNEMTWTILFSNQNFRFLHVNSTIQWTKFLSFRVTRL